MARDSWRFWRSIPVMGESPAIMKPLRWLAHLPLAALPVLAAGVEAPRLEQAVGRQVVAALAASGADWATVAVDGRDVEIRGVAPDRARIEAAHQAVAQAFGVRRVEMHAGTALP